jgi:hypothetical protein
MRKDIEAAIAGLRAINDAIYNWNVNRAAGGYASHFRSRPQMDHDLYMELLAEIVRFDDEPAGTLEQLQFEAEWEREPEIIGRAPAMYDEEWDYLTAKAA